MCNNIRAACVSTAMLLIMLASTPTVAADTVAQRCGVDPAASVPGLAAYSGDVRLQWALKTNDDPRSGCDCERDKEAEATYKADHEGKARVIFKLHNTTAVDGGFVLAPRVCEAYDCTCNPQCYTCTATFHWLGGAFDAWQAAMLALFFVALVYNTRVALGKIAASRINLDEKAKLTSNGRRPSFTTRLGAAAGIKFSLPLGVLFTIELALLLRLLWFLDPMKISAFAPEGTPIDGAGVIYGSVIQALVLKLPQILMIACALALCLVYQDLLARTKHLTQGAGKGGKRRIVYTSIALLFALTLPGALNKDNNLLRTVGNLTFMVACLVLLVAAIVFGHSLAKVIKKNSVPKRKLSILRRLSSFEKKNPAPVTPAVTAAPLTPQQKKMARTASRIQSNVHALTLSGVSTILALAFNIFFKNHIHLHMIFWYWAHCSELAFCFGTTYSLKVDGSAAAKRATVAPGSKAPKSTAPSTA